MTTIRRRPVLCMIAGLIAVLSACAGGPQYVPVDIQDRSTTLYSVRAEWHPRTQTTGTNGTVVKDGIEVQYTRVSGKDDQELLAGQAIAVGGRSIIGPQLVSHRIDISYAHIAYSGTARFTGENPVEMDAFLGAGRVDFRLQSSATTSAPLTLETEQVDYALTMGLGLRWWFFANSAVEGRLILLTANPFSYFAGTFGKGGQTDMLEGELALVFRPIGNVAIRGGYALMDLTPKKSSNSSFDFKLSGPFLGLGILF